MGRVEPVQQVGEVDHSGTSAARHSFVERRPTPSLAGLLSNAYVVRVGATVEPYTEIGLPSGGMELRCQVGMTLELVGPQSGPLSQLMRPGTTVVGVRFAAGMASTVLGMPASHLADQTLDAHELLGRAARTAAERIAESTSPAAAASILESLVLELRTDDHSPDPLVQEVVRALMPWRGEALTALPARLGISERQLRRRCQAEVGLAPKVLHRLLRFQGFLALGHKSLGHVDRAAEHHGGRRGHALADLASEAGYADQAHLTRECRRLAGKTPFELLEEFARECGDHDHGASYEPMLRQRPHSWS